MPLMPKKVKYRKTQKGSRAGNAGRGNKLAFGQFGIQALERGWITNNQIEAARIAITRHMQRRGQVWIRIFPHKPITKKPLEVRMGKGKGNVETWVAVVRPGTVLFEITGCSEIVAREAFSRAANKLPVRCRMLEREEI
ncbi:MAG: 50S ribosomal protein L16 [Lentisphaerae bacterium]|nr:MAG: 50S ribosomal protein L16 [Lentisphaerota bacterium]